eukprot:1846811-Alexandrium_andersonii.AAC.1
MCIRDSPPPRRAARRAGTRRLPGIRRRVLRGPWALRLALGCGCCVPQFVYFLFCILGYGVLGAGRLPIGGAARSL